MADSTQQQTSTFEEPSVETPEDWAAQDEWDRRLRAAARLSPEDREALAGLNATEAAELEAAGG